jgi:hypothetical protein
MDNLTNECQQIAMEVFAQNGAKNNASTMAAAQLIGGSFLKEDTRAGSQQRRFAQPRQSFGSNPGNHAGVPREFRRCVRRYLVHTSSGQLFIS